MPNDTKIAENVAAIAGQRAAAASARFAPGDRVAVVNRPGGAATEDNVMYRGVVEGVEATSYGPVVAVKCGQVTRRVDAVRVRRVK